MTAAQHEKDGNLQVALSTWIYLLHVAGVDPASDQLVAICADLDASQDEEAGDAVGRQLVACVGEILGESDHSPDQVASIAQDLYGRRVTTSLGSGDREARTLAIRKYQFDHNVPWLARIWERHADGSVKPSWLLISRVTDQVTAMDPNPWDDIPEDRVLPIHDFQVLWELDACTSLSIQ